MIVVDTDVIIWLLKGNEQIKERFTKIVTETEGLIYITPIQIAEIYAGMRERERIDTEIFLDAFYILTIDDKVGKIAGEFMNKYQKSHGVTLADAIISACTKINGLKLWALNKKHYPMLEGVEFIV